MSRERRTIAITVLVLAVGAFAYRIVSEKCGPEKPEPRYNGGSLSEWLAAYRPPDIPGGSPGAAEIAVRSMGTNALPFILEWIRYELPPWRRTLLQLATWHQGEDKRVIFGKSLIEAGSVRRAEAAISGFAILNTNAVSAIPELGDLMRNNQKPEMSLRAIWALQGIGGPATAALTNALADPAQTNRSQIIEAIYGVELMSPFYYGGFYRGACLPALTRALNDPDDRVRRQATNTLYNLSLHYVTRLDLAPQTLTNAPAN